MEAIYQLSVLSFSGEGGGREFFKHSRESEFLKVVESLLPNHDDKELDAQLIEAPGWVTKVVSERLACLTVPRVLIETTLKGTYRVDDTFKKV